jgi:hypothetical protein
MEGGHDEVAGERGLHCNPGGVLITDLANEDYVRILAQD